MRYVICFFFLIILSITNAGCSTLEKLSVEDTSKYLIPVNIAAGYFGSVGLHEAGHAITGYGIGADSVKVSVLPEQDDKEKWHLGLTSIKKERGISELENTLFLTMGPTASFLGHASSRIALRSGELPYILQPTVAWFDLFNQISFYYHTISGLSKGHTDLGKTDRWISGVMLGGVLLFDVVDFVLEGDPLKRFKVLFGEDFYENKTEKLKPSCDFLVTPYEDGGFAGFKILW